MRQAKLARASRTIRHDQRLTTGSEPNCARREATNCAKPQGRRMSATTQVKVLSPEIIHIAQGQGFHFLEANSVADDKVSPSRRAGV